MRKVASGVSLAVYVVKRTMRRLSDTETTETRELFETESERNLAAFLKPFFEATTGSALAETVWRLARDGGYSNAGSLHYADDRALNRIDINNHDRPIILLAAWLHALKLHEYGPGLVANGFTSLSLFAPISDEQLQQSGVTLMGHRRVLLRQAREDLAQRKDLDIEWPIPQERKSAQEADDLVERSAAEAQKAVRRELPGRTTAIDPVHKFSNQDAWNETWKVTADSCLTHNGGVYFAPRTPREFSLACADGTRLSVM